MKAEERAIVVAHPRPSLKAKAVLAWERERPAREAERVERQARELQAVRDRFIEIFGSEHKIELGIDAARRITATIEDLRFSTHIYSFGIPTVTVFLLERCLNCGEDVPVGSISNIADLGELLQEAQSKQRHVCGRT